MEDATTESIVQTTEVETEGTPGETTQTAEPTLDDVIRENEVENDAADAANANGSTETTAENDTGGSEVNEQEKDDADNTPNERTDQMEDTNTESNNNNDAQEDKEEGEPIEETRKEKKSKKRKKKKDEEGGEKKKKKKKKSQKEEIMQSLSKDIFGDSDEEGEDALVPEHVSSAEDDLEEKSKKKLKKLAKETKKKKRKSREERRSEGGGGEEAEGGGTSSEAPDGGDSESGGEGEKPRKELSDFDQILESLKNGKGRRKKADKMSEAEQSHLIEQFKERMDAAAARDAEAFMNKQLPIYKLKMLPEVQAQLSKRNLQQLMVENDILEAIAQWLSPMPDSSLPNLKIRTALLAILTTFPPVDTDDLKESGIGKVVMLLWKHPTETAENKKHARFLIERWSRPIFGISARYSDLKAERDDEADRLRRENENSEAQQLAAARRKAALESSSGSHDFDLDGSASKTSSGGGKNLTYHARIPQRLAMDYKIQPKSSIDAEAMNKKKAGTDKRFQTLQKKMLLKKGGSGSIRAHNLSVEGRNMTTHIG